MPHIAVSMYPGRNDETKEALARKLRAFVAEELNLKPEVVSVSIADVEKESWKSFMEEIPEDTIFVKPGAN